MTFWYLSSPYSKYAAGLDAAYADACCQMALLVSEGTPVFSPIVHSHGIAKHGGLDPLDHARWMEIDRPFMRAACGLIECRLPGWEESVGMRIEREVFAALGRPVHVMTPGTAPLTLRKPSPPVRGVLDPEPPFGGYDAGPSMHVRGALG